MAIFGDTNYFENKYSYYDFSIKKNLHDGDWIFYYDLNKKKVGQTGTIYMHKKIGSWRTFYRSGLLKSEEYFDSLGKKNGIFYGKFYSIRSGLGWFEDDYNFETDSLQKIAESFIADSTYTLIKYANDTVVNILGSIYDIAYYFNGNVEAFSTYVDNTIPYIEMYFYKSSELKEIKRYLRSDFWGHQISYYENGNKKEECCYSIAGHTKYAEMSGCNSCKLCRDSLFVRPVPSPRNSHVFYKIPINKWYENGNAEENWDKLIDSKGNFFYQSKYYDEKGYIKTISNYNSNFLLDGMTIYFNSEGKKTKEEVYSNNALINTIDY